MSDRVVVNADGFAVRPADACSHYGVFSKVIFERADGWKLGAPPEFERTALAQWPDQWVAFRRWPLYERQPIRDYRIPSETKR